MPCRYWPKNRELINDLCQTKTSLHEKEHLPPEFTEIPLPAWAVDLGVNGCMLIPTFCLKPLKEPARQHVDWLSACYWYLNGLAEREFERKHGSIHPYRFRLRGWDARMWEYAWVNRIALFLRRYVANNADRQENELFGQLPDEHITLTHDVDSINKTFNIRFKQSAFHLFNSLRNLSKE